MTHSGITLRSPLDPSAGNIGFYLSRSVRVCPIDPETTEFGE